MSEGNNNGGANPLAAIYSQIPEWAKQSPVIIVLLVVFYLILSGHLVTAARFAECQRQRDEFKGMALRDLQK